MMVCHGGGDCDGGPYVRERVPERGIVCVFVCERERGDRKSVV